MFSRSYPGTLIHSLLKLCLERDSALELRALETETCKFVLGFTTPLSLLT